MTVKQRIALPIFVISILALDINVVGAKPFENLTDDTILAEVLGQKICLKDIEPTLDVKQKHQASKTDKQFVLWLKQTRSSNLARYFKPLWDEYTKEKGLTATKQEIEEFRKRMMNFMVAEQKKWKIKKDNLEKELIAENLEAEKKAELEKHRNRYSSRLEISPDPSRMYQDGGNVLTSIILSWKLKKELYNQYKGRVVFQQAGPEPLDAFRLFFEEQQSKGKFKFYNKDSEDLFWDYYRNVKHTFCKDPNEAEQLINTPWWLQERKEDYHDTEAEWGEEVNGLQIRIEVDARRRVFYSGKTPNFKVDLLNTGDNAFSCAPLEQFCEVEVDGKWYNWNGPVVVEQLSLELKPKHVYYDFFKIKLAENWALRDSSPQENKSQLLSLSLGTHIIRVKYKTMIVGETLATEVVTNSLKFQIRPSRKRVKSQ